MSFDQAIEFTLRQEGGYVNHPQDPGGETKYGISKRAYPNLDIKSLTISDAKDIYYKDYWIPAKCEEMPQDVAIAVFDMAVNSGIVTATKCLQRALGIADDGICGPLTLFSVNNKNPVDTFKRFNAMRLKFFATLRTYGTFGMGWFGRVVDLARYVGGL